MNVNSVNNLPSVDSQLSVGAVGNAPPQPPQSGAEPGFGAATTASISGPGRMFHELKELQDSDPAKFKQVVGDMASALRADAKNASGDEATRLSSIAGRLDKVAESGKLSDMAPGPADGARQAHHAHGHHGGHGGGAVISDIESAFSSAMGDSSSTTTANDASSKAASATST